MEAWKTPHNSPMKACNDIFNEHHEREIASSFYYVYDLFGGRPFQQVFPFIPIQEEKRKLQQEDITCEQSQESHQMKNDQLWNASSLTPDNIFADIGQSQPNLQSGHQSSGGRGDKYPELFSKIMEDSPFEVQKNNNMVKKLLKTLNKVYYTQGRKFFENFPQIEKQMNSLTKNHRRKYSEDKNFNNNLNAMKAMFSQFEQSCQPAQRSFLVRKMAHSLIRTEVIPSVLANNQVKSMKKSYLFGLKVQMLRSRSKQLMERTEIH